MKHHTFPGALTAVLLFSAALPGGLGAQTADKAPFGWGIRPRFLWAGSWETGKNTINRGDLRLDLPWGGLSLRVQAVDRRPAEFGAFIPGEAADRGISAFGGGLYHGDTGSRLLYGVLDERGLPARVRNPWIRSLPFPENRKPSSSDLRTEPSSTKEPETYLYLGLPRRGPLGAFASLTLDKALAPAVGTGFDLRFDKAAEFRAEGFYTGGKLGARESSAWFSEKPPLPEREFRFLALGLLFESPLFGAGSDWAYSETAVFGRGFYGSLGLRAGNRPWRVSLALDGAGDRFVDRDGAEAGGGFRAAVRLDHYGPRSSLFRLGTSLRAGGPGKALDRSSTQLYYRFPAAPAKAASALRLSRAGLTLGRNGSNPAKVEDSLEGLLGLRRGPWTSVFQGRLSGLTLREDASPPLPFPLPEKGLDFHSAGLSGEIGWNPGIVSLSARLGCTLRRGKEAAWDTALSASVRGKPGRLSLKLVSPDLPGDWTLNLSWRLELP